MDFFPEWKCIFCVTSWLHQSAGCEFIAFYLMVICCCVCYQVVSDFDMTLTRFADADGKKCDSSYCKLNFTADQQVDKRKLEHTL
jgi:hypothetical protein